MKNWIRIILRRFLGVEEIEENISIISNDIYDLDAMLQGFRVPKVEYKKTIKWAGKDKPIK